MENYRHVSYNIDADIYYKTLCSSGVSFVKRQPAQIEQKRNILVENKQKLVYNNYDSFIKLSNFSKDLIDDFQDIENSLETLQQHIPQFKQKCDEFSSNAQKISLRWKNVSSMLAKYPQLIEFLEIPQLLHNCIRTFYYEDAIKIFNFITKFCSKNKHMASIFQNMLVEVETCKDSMINQIMKEMQTNVQLPVCIKLVDYLRQTDRFSENQLRINFLTCRDVWFQGTLSKAGNILLTLGYISTITELFRVNIFDIVTQYQAIFPEIYLDLSSERDGKQSQHETDSKIINSWLLLKIEQYVTSLKKTLEACVAINSVLSLDSVIDHSFYFGLSLSKIGADIRPQLIIMFNDFIKKRFKYNIDCASQRFENSLSDLFKKPNQGTLNASSDNSLQEINLSDFTINQNFYNDICATFKEFQHNIPLSLIGYFTITLNQALESIVFAIKVYLKKHEFSLNNAEFEVYSRFCKSVRDQLLPLLVKTYQQFCPVSAVSQKLGFTIIDLSKIDSFQQFTLDIKTPIEGINGIIKELSVKMQ